MSKKIDKVDAELRNGLDALMDRVISHAPNLSSAENTILNALANELQIKEDVEFTFVRKGGELLVKCNDVQYKLVDPLVPKPPKP
jgi:hypothetical protein